MCHAARLTAAVEAEGFRFDVISSVIQALCGLVDRPQQHVQQQPAYSNGAWSGGPNFGKLARGWPEHAYRTSQPKYGPIQMLIASYPLERVFRATSLHGMTWLFAPSSFPPPRVSPPPPAHICVQACVERPYLDHSNVPDLTKQPFYRFLASTWFVQLIARHIITQVRAASMFSLIYIPPVPPKFRTNGCMPAVEYLHSQLCVCKHADHLELYTIPRCN